MPDKPIPAFEPEKSKPIVVPGEPLPLDEPIESQDQKVTESIEEGLKTIKLGTIAQ